jgi:hypothetical protein
MRNYTPVENGIINHSYLSIVNEPFSTEDALRDYLWQIVEAFDVELYGVNNNHRNELLRRAKVFLELLPPIKLKYNQ